MRRQKWVVTILLGAALAALTACAGTPAPPILSVSATTQPPPAAPRARDIPLDRSASDYPDASQEQEDAVESPQSVPAAEVEVDAERTAFREASRMAKAAKDRLPSIDVSIEEAVSIDGSGIGFEDRYTRIQIVTLDRDSYDMAGFAAQRRETKEDKRDNNTESRRRPSPTAKGSASITRFLIADFDILNPDIRTTRALSSWTQSSDNAKNDASATIESTSVYATPYFKVSPDTVIESRFRIQLSEEYSSSAGSSVINALQTAANTIAPTSALVTFFNAPAMLRASNFLNTQSTSLFGQSITEESTSAFAIKSWTRGPILAIRADVPPSKNTKNTEAKQVAGTWVVLLEKPVASMFTTKTILGRDTPDFTGVSSAEILAFNIGTDLRVYDYIFARLELSDQIAALNDTADPEAARLICSRVSRGLSATGFTTFDAAAAVWAASESERFNSAARSALQDRKNCGLMWLWSQMNQ